MVAYVLIDAEITDALPDCDAALRQTCRGGYHLEGRSRCGLLLGRVIVLRE